MFSIVQIALSMIYESIGSCSSLITRQDGTAVIPTTTLKLDISSPDSVEYLCEVLVIPTMIMVATDGCCSDLEADPISKLDLQLCLAYQRQV